MAITQCKANIGSRKEPQACGQPVAPGMLAACKQHATKLIPTGTQGIYYRGGSYVAVTNYRGRETKSFHATLPLAREAKSDRTGTTRKAPAARVPFDQHAREWVGACQGRTVRGLDADTRASYARALELHHVPHFGKTPLRDIDRNAVKSLVEKLQREGLSAASIARYLAPLRALFSDAVEDGLIPVNPAVNLHINSKVNRGQRKQRPASKKVLTRGELTGVLAAIPQDSRLLFELLAGTGCRISEALGLDWSDLAQSENTTTLRIERQYYRGRLKPNAKTDAGERTIILEAGLAAKLWNAGADAVGPMFCTRTGRRLNDRNLRRILDRAAAAAGVDGVSFHRFRHSHGSMLIDQGWTIPQVSERLGHADPSITAKVYSHAMSDSQPDLSFLAALAPTLAPAQAPAGQDSMPTTAQGTAQSTAQ